MPSRPRYGTPPVVRFAVTGRNSTSSAKIATAAAASRAANASNAFLARSTFASDTRGGSRPTETGARGLADQAAQRDERDHLERDRQHDREAVAVLREPEHTAGLAQIQRGERSRRDRDAAQGEQPPDGGRSHGDEQSDSDDRRGREVEDEQRPDRRNHGVRVRGVLLEVDDAGADQRQRAYDPYLSHCRACFRTA